MNSSLQARSGCTQREFEMDYTPFRGSPVVGTPGSSRGGMSSSQLNAYSKLDGQTPGKSSRLFSIASIDLSQMDKIDPSTSDGGTVLFDREVPMEIRSQKSNSDMPQSVGSLEAIRAKIVNICDPSGAQTLLRVELTSESDLFFNYRYELTTASYDQLQQRQRLMVDFEEFNAVVARMMLSCIREPHQHLAVLILIGKDEARLDFIKNMEYKFVEMLSLDFKQSPLDIQKQSISYRYNVMKARISGLQGRLHEVQDVIKVKNPSLLLQFQKGTAKIATGLNDSSSSVRNGTPRTPHSTYKF